jgi:AraC-like DNA-binding protein
LTFGRNAQGLPNLEDLRHYSGMKGDPLTDILSLTSARCAEVGILIAGGSWALRFPPPQKIKFVAVLKGNCWLTFKDESTPLQVKTGDVFVLPAERAYLLASDLNAPQADGLKIFAGATGKIAKVGIGDEFFAVGAHIALDPERGGLLSEALPPLLHVSGNSSNQLAQLLCIQTIRSYLEASGSGTAGWLRALGDKRIAPALRLMHREPARAWRLDELAKEVAMSRTSFAVRFKKIAGVAPLTYLLNLRMRFAEQGLREGSRSVSELGLSLGYTTESAFSNAFKRTTGVAPKRYQSIFARMDRSTSRKGDRGSNSSNLRLTAVRKELHAR